MPALRAGTADCDVRGNTLGINICILCTYESLIFLKRRKTARLIGWNDDPMLVGNNLSKDCQQAAVGRANSGLRAWLKSHDVPKTLRYESGSRRNQLGSRFLSAGGYKASMVSILEHTGDEPSIEASKRASYRKIGIYLPVVLPGIVHL